MCFFLIGYQGYPDLAFINRKYLDKSFTSMPSLQNHSFWRQMAVNYINRCYLEPKLLVRKKKKRGMDFYQAVSDSKAEC